MTYYRRRIAGRPRDFVTVGLLPLGAAGFLGWVFVKSLGEAPLTQRWSPISIVVVGLVLMLSARFILRSTFARSGWRARSGPGAYPEPADPQAAGSAGRRS